MSARWEQLLYTSVDHVVDGRASSGWQVKDRSEDMDDGLAQELVSLVQPQLNPIETLSGFPTEEEIAAADRRLTQRVVHGMPVLLHTAPAGQDTTGRPNTVTHVLVDRSGDGTRQLLGTSAWRAPWWSTPYGAEAVRGASLAPQEAIGPGGDVTFDRAAALIAGGSAGPVLAALADAIAHGVSAGSSPHSLAVLVIDRADDVPQWLGALERTCVAETARRIQWSTLERVSSERDLEALRDRGFSVVGVPRSDISSIGRVPSGCRIIDPESRAGLDEPRTPWGRFVRAMASDITVWIPAMDALAMVENNLVDQQGVPFAWSAAMAQIVSPGLLDEAFDGDARAAAVDVVTTSPVAGAGAGLLRRYLDEVVDGLEDASAGTWYEALSGMPEDAPVDGIVHMLAARYVDAAVQDRQWLEASPERADRPAGPLRRALEAWSAGSSGEEKVRTAVEIAQAAVDAGGGRDRAGTRSPEERRARVLVALASDGITMPEDILSRFLFPIADGIVLRRSDVDSRTIEILPGPLRDRLRTLVDDRLADLDRPASADAQNASREDEPHLGGMQVRALVAGAADLDRTPYVGLQASLTELIDQNRRPPGRSGGALEETEELAESCMRMLEAITARRSEGERSSDEPREASITLTAEAADAVGALFPLTALQRLPALIARSQAERIADRIALRDVEHPLTIAWARARLGGAVSPSTGDDRIPDGGGGTAPRVSSRPSDVAQLVLAAAQPVLALPEAQYLRGLDDLDRGAELVRAVRRRPSGPGWANDRSGAASSRRLVDLVQVRWDAAAVLLHVIGLKRGDRPTAFLDDGFVSKVPGMAEEDSTRLLALPDPQLFPGIDPRAPLGTIPARALRRLVDDANSSSGPRGRSSSRTGRLDPALREAAVTILRTYVRVLGGAMESTVREQLTAIFAMDDDAVKRAKQILGIGTSADRSEEKGMAGAVSWTRGLLKRKEERDG